MEGRYFRVLHVTWDEDGPYKMRWYAWSIVLSGPESFANSSRTISFAYIQSLAAVALANCDRIMCLPAMSDRILS